MDPRIARSPAEWQPSVRLPLPQPSAKRPSRRLDNCWPVTRRKLPRWPRRLTTMLPGWRTARPAAPLGSYFFCSAGRIAHFNSSAQFTTTTIFVEYMFCSLSLIIRNRWPSRETS